ncbi:MAG: AAA family ATPase [Thermosynechococcaceae cyanobacterium]
MTLEEALAMINRISTTLRNRTLNPSEIVAVTAAWEGVKYEEVVSEFNSSYLGSRAGPDVWRLLSAYLKCKVSKKNFRSVLEKAWTVESTHIQKPKITNQNGIQIVGVPPKIDHFIGYSTEIKNCLAALRGHKSIFIDGPQGIGKTALAVHVARSLASLGIETVLWKSIHYGPTLNELIEDLLRMLDIQESASGSDNRLTLLINFLSRKRCVLVLDDAQSLLSGHKNFVWQQYGENFEDYDLFFRRLIEEQNSTTLIVTSRIRFDDWISLRDKGFPIEMIHLDGLGSEAAAIFEEQGLTHREHWPELIESYRGNPMMLQMVARRIRRLYGGDTSSFVELHSTVLLDPFLSTLNKEFSPAGSMSKQERELMNHLAELLADSPSVTFEAILNCFKAMGRQDTSAILNDVESLISRSLIEEVSKHGKQEYTLAPIVRKYVLVDPLGYVNQVADPSNG